jgi:hypothetical protein
VQLLSVYFGCRFLCVRSACICLWYGLAVIPVGDLDCWAGVEVALNAVVPNLRSRPKSGSWGV